MRHVVNIASKRVVIDGGLTLRMLSIYFQSVKNAECHTARGSYRGGAITWQPEMSEYRNPIGTHETYFGGPSLRNGPLAGDGKYLGDFCDTTAIFSWQADQDSGWNHLGIEISPLFTLHMHTWEGGGKSRLRLALPQ